jgi:hypothetical protein
VKTSLSSREGSRQSRAREGARRSRPARHGVAMALRRPSSACAQGMAPHGEAERFGEKPGVGEAVLAGASARGRPGGRAGGETVTNGVSRGGDGSDGRFLNNSKFQNPVRKLSFSPSWPQIENF